MKKISILFITVIATSVVLFSCKNDSSAKDGGAVSLTNEVDSLSYALGVNIGENMKRSQFDEINSAAFAQAIDDVYAGTSTMTNEDAGVYINNYMMAKATNQPSASPSAASEEGMAFLAENATKEGVVSTASGLQYEVISEGTGANPAATDEVTVHYHGTLIDGTVFDSSVERDQPATFPLNGVIAGWTEGLQLMKEGGKTRFYIPSELAYGNQGAGELIAPGATLIFDVELLKVGK